MKKLISASLLVFFASFSYAQIKIDSIKVYGNTLGFDSLYLKYTSYIPKVTQLSYFSYNDVCGTTPMGLKFVGCSTAVSVQKDTLIIFRPNGGSIGSSFLKFYTVWDTSATCSSPASPISTDSYFYNVCNLTAVDELENLASKFVLFPNPAREFFNIQMAEEITLNQVELINLQGSLIKTYETQYERFDLNAVANGVYYLKLTTSEGIAVKKIMVNK